MEELREFLAPIIALLMAGLWAEVRNRVLNKKTKIDVEKTFLKQDSEYEWRDSVKRHVYKQFNIVKAKLYEAVDKHIIDRQDAGVKSDIIDMLHGLKVAMPLDKRSIQLRDGVKTVVEDVRAWVKSEILSEPLADMSVEEMTEYIEVLTTTVRDTIKNDLIKQSYKSPVLEDVFLEFGYSDLLDTIGGIVKHTVRAKK